MADNNTYYDLDLKGSVIKQYLKEVPNLLPKLDGQADRLVLVAMAEGGNAATTVSYVLDKIAEKVQVNTTNHTVTANGQTITCLVPNDFVAAGDLLVGTGTSAKYARLIKGDAGKVLKSTADGLTWGDEAIKSVDNDLSGNAITEIELVGSTIVGHRGNTFAIDNEVIHNSIFTNAGDILIGTGSGTYTTFAKSATAGQVLKTTNNGYTWADEPVLSLTSTGAGNAITGLSVSGHAITATKGETFATAQTVNDLDTDIGILVGNLGTQATFSYSNGELTITINNTQPSWPI